jgi:EAL domain-containing protein (putative c-di-GMP-specific phosphodiesterase class I)/GGDEF domain-containing protein
MALREEHRVRPGPGRDRVTGLWSPGPFAAALRRQAAIAHRHGRPGAVIVLGLPDAGDAGPTETARRVAAVLRTRLRATDLVARLDEREFGVLLAEVPAASARLVADELVDAVAQALGRGARVDAGLAVFPEEGRGRSAPELLADAEVARLAAAGSPSRAERLRRELEGDGLVLAGRPVVEVDTDVVLQHAVFVGRRTACGDVAEANELLHAAERFGRGRAVDACVVDRVIDLAAHRAAEGLVGQLRLTLSGSAIADAGLVGRIVQRLVDRPDAGPMLVFAISEEHAVADVGLARAFVARLGELGCCFALDDYGESFGSFALLRDLPVDFIALAPALVRGMATSDRDRAIALAVVEAADALGTATIAKGVDDEERMIAARGFGIPLMQGRLLGGEGWTEQPLDCRAAARP